MFDKTFFHFLFGFVAIIGLGFAVLIAAGYEKGQTPPSPVDNVAQPQ